MVEAAIAGQAFGRYFVVDDFMCMGMLHRNGRPNLILNKHVHTRRYLNLDATGHAYRYLAPPPESASSGQYRPYRDLVAAIDALHLYEMPWLYGSGFADRQLGLSWEERWDHPDVQAWFERRERQLTPPRRRSRSPMTASHSVGDSVT
jgi:hypothetical protein